MSVSKLLHFQWKDFNEIVSSSFHHAHDVKDFSDVTLCVGSGDQIKAHKLILSASSPLFFTILQKNEHPCPILYLKGVKLSDLKHVLEFIYHGEVSVAQSEVDGFLEVAKELQVQGICNMGICTSNSPLPTQLSEIVTGDTSSSTPAAPFQDNCSRFVSNQDHKDIHEKITYSHDYK